MVAGQINLTIRVTNASLEPPAQGTRHVRAATTIVDEAREADMVVRMVVKVGGACIHDLVAGVAVRVASASAR